IKEARELHREGLGTASVRRRLREGNDPVDAEELIERLDRISGALEGLQGDLGSANGASSSQETLRTVLKKQDLLISAVSSLTEKMESLFSANDRSRTVPPDSLEAYEEERFFERPERLQEARENTRRTRSMQDSGDWTVASNGTTGVMVDEPVAEVATDEAAAGALEDDATTRIIPGPADLLGVPERREKFGALARRRRKGILALLLLALLVGAVLAWGLYGSGEEVEQSATSDEQSVEEDSQSVPEAVEEAPPVSLTAEIPDLIGMTFPEAEDELAGAGLKLGAWNEIPDYEVPAGRVVVQGPEAGEEVDPDTPVDLIVSAGPPVYGPEVPVDGVGGGVGNGQYPGVNPLPPNEAAVFPPGPL
ncbi:MAG: PASTA domain-containing protein, partial [Actinomycetota bacterium]|nr:PASTA domain-containing protein [Actinomycetota bacterium]